MSVERLSDAKMDAVWKGIDGNLNGYVEAQEFGPFMKLGVHAMKMRKHEKSGITRHLEARARANARMMDDYLQSASQARLLTSRAPPAACLRSPRPRALLTSPPTGEPGHLPTLCARLHASSPRPPCDLRQASLVIGDERAALEREYASLQRAMRRTAQAEAELGKLWSSVPKTPQRPPSSHSRLMQSSAQPE